MQISIVYENSGNLIKTEVKSLRVHENFDSTAQGIWCTSIIFDSINDIYHKPSKLVINIYKPQYKSAAHLIGICRKCS